MHIPRIVIGGTITKTGKTLISLGLMRALVKRGLEIQPFKIGPDFIDPSFHYFATGRFSRNLDSYMMSEKDIQSIFCKATRDADVAVIEGKTALYDSHNAIDEKGSTAHVAKILKAPVILVANAERISRSIAAQLLGYKIFDPDVLIAGVILNKVGNERHAKKVEIATKNLAKIEVLGVIPRRNDIVLPYRHLGLVPAHEREEFSKIFDLMANIVEEFVDVDRIIEIAEEAEEIECDFEENIVEKSNVKIGIIKDKPFSFYYQDNVDALSSLAEIVYIDSLKDRRLPKVDALYIGGGFPEVFAKELESNRRLRENIYEFCSSGNPVYAECGGLMFLGESIIDFNKEEYEMVGFLPIKTEMKRKFQALGYTEYLSEKDTPISRKGDRFVAHEFHYSKVHPLKKLEFAFKVLRGKGIMNGKDGILKDNTLATYAHIHVYSYKGFVKNFVKSASKG
uniref:Cobyrinate a,c-diamide synthase n=1 Tax=Geoglobus ahangari TaxID=113653 RepID=A0A7C3YF99_9EURY